MVRRPNKPKKADPAATRNLILEQQLCQAISALNVVELKYEQELQWRTFEPHCVHTSSVDPNQVNVYGNLTADPNKPNPKLGPRNFEVGKVSAINITNAKYQFPAEFDRFAPLFKGGIICCVQRF